MKVFLVGNPNAGKSTLFNALTRSHAKVGNWHGVTVGALKARGAFGEGEADYVDLPGVYAAQGRSMEERLALAALRAEGDAGVLFVAECSSLARVLPLFYALCRGRRAALVLTKRRAHQRKGGSVNVPALSRLLGVPVFCSEGMKRGELARAAGRILCSSPLSGEVPALPEDCYIPVQVRLSKAEALLMRGYVALPLFIALLAFAFFVTFADGAPGDVMKECVAQLFTKHLGGAAQRIPSPALRSLVADGVLAGLGTVLGFLPQIMLLFTFLILMEESGFLSRLAALTDGAFARIGLNGRAVFSLVMGFGCTAAAVLTTRSLDDRQVQRRTILALSYIPCSAKLPVLLTLSASFLSRPFLGVAALYVLGTALSLLAAALTNRAPRAPFVMELAPLQLPRPLFVAKSLLFQAKQFIIKTGTVILAFLIVSRLLSSFDWAGRFTQAEGSMLADVCRALGWLFAPAGMHDWRIAYAALSGLIAKENTAAALAVLCGGFPYGGASAFAFAVFMLTCSPCVSAIAAAARETGRRRALLYALLQTAGALLMCYLAYFLWNAGALALPVAALPVAAYLLVRKGHERIHRRRKHHAARLHR